MTGGIISCEGWSRCVASGRLYGQAVAVKFAYLNTQRAEALLKEVVAYQKMEKLWGVFVPRLTGYGTTCTGRAVFVVIESIDGVELGEIAVTQEVKTPALEALDAVHECGLLHGDIEARNIMVVWRKQPPVRFLDFGFSCVTRSKKLRKAERVRLEYLLAYM
nr:uncharacterized protein LOC112295933 [Physcomitrium patens]|eukprot:XP_024403753.1 uncharacterized protein LOC112295933 [Physcomitrella patens]